MMDGLLAQKCLDDIEATGRGAGRGVMRGVGRYSHAVSAGSTGTLADVISSVCCELDATQPDSYSGSGTTWANRISSPADGASQTDYDFVTDYHTGSNPTFTGTAGSASAYWAVDGNDCFKLTNFSSCPTLYTAQDSGTSGNQWWVAICYFANSVQIRALWGSSWVAGDIGVYGWVDSNGNRVLYRGLAGSLNNSAFETAPANDWTGTTDDVCVIITADMAATTNNVKFYTVSSTPVTDSVDYGDASETPNNNFLIGATSNTDTTAAQQGYLASGAKIYAWACGNSFLSDSEAFDIADYFGTQHSRTYWSS